MKTTICVYFLFENLTNSHSFTPQFQRGKKAKQNHEPQVGRKWLPPCKRKRERWEREAVNIAFNLTLSVSHMDRDISYFWYQNIKQSTTGRFHTRVAEVQYCTWLFIHRKILVLVLLLVKIHTHDNFVSS